MEIKILWTEEAIKRLKDISDYYIEKVSTDFAQKLVNEIIDSVDILIKNPELGPKEILLKHRKKKYRYLVQNNYKIIYWEEESILFIATVFDTRQNPRKLPKTVK